MPENLYAPGGKLSNVASLEAESGTSPQTYSARNSRRLAYLDLVRLPNLFTAAADVLAGFLFAGGMSGEWSILLRLLTASLCLYAGGVALNDVCDAEQDSEQRCHRPIPCGLIARSTALRFAGILLGFGIFMAITVSSQAFLVATAILILVALYNLLKHTPLAPPLMGLCRACNLLLGMHGMETLLPLPAVRPIGAMFLYVTALTIFARKETEGGSQIRLSIGTLGIAAAIVSLWGFRWYGYNARFDEYRILAAIMLAGVVCLGLDAIIRPSPFRIQRAVKSFVMGIILLDSCVAWVSAGPLAALGVAALLVPCFFVARSMRVT